MTTSGSFMTKIQNTITCTSLYVNIDSNQWATRFIHISIHLTTTRKCFWNSSLFCAIPVTNEPMPSWWTKRDVWLWIMANGFNHIKQYAKHQLHWKKSHDAITSTLRCYNSFPSFCFWFLFFAALLPHLVSTICERMRSTTPFLSGSSNWPVESILNGNLVCRIPQIYTAKVNVRSTHHSVVYSCFSKRANLLIRNFTVMIHLATL